jgi:crotonobetainyl-CoA:carnitine CoA-transferase CaiB-like acyl-CoA transferase
MTDLPAPLSGLRVVALEQAVAAPLCSRHLADLGADVIKVERPDGGDFARGYDTFVKGMASHFVWLNYGKRSIALDVKSEDGRAVLLRLLETADVFVANLSPGAVDRLVTPEELEQLNPGLVTCEISGYGASGPYRERKAFDLLVQGEAGVTANTGSPGEPAKSGVSLADLGGGIYAVAAILAALRTRDRTGRGQRLHISMFDVLVEWMSPLLLAYREGGVAIAPAGTRHATITPYGPFLAADGTVLNIAVQNDRQWLLLCEVLGLVEASGDARLATNSGRLQHRDAVESLVARAVAGWPRDDLEAALDRCGIPWGQLNDTAAVVAHPQLAADQRWRSVELPSGESVQVLADPFWDRTDDVVRSAPRVPRLGEHTDQVLRDLARRDGG